MGPQASRALNRAAVAQCKTLIWNGPMGVFEMGAFETGTKDLMDAVVEATRAGNVCRICRLCAALSATPTRVLLAVRILTLRRATLSLLGDGMRLQALSP